MLPLVFPALARAGVPGLVHALTTREGGVSRGAHASLNLGFSSGDRAERVRENRRRVADALGFDGLWTARQVHGARVVEAGGEGETPEADVLLVTRPGVLAGVLGADCPLALVVAPAGRALALVHSGWRGTVAGALPAAIDALVRMGSRPVDLRVGLGPGIGPARYEIDGDVASRLAGAVEGGEACVAARPNGRYEADLRGLLLRQALEGGVLEANVETAGRCTYDEDARFFSHRRDGPATGRHALVAGWR